LSTIPLSRPVAQLGYSRLAVAYSEGTTYYIRMSSPAAVDRGSHAHHSSLVSGWQLLSMSALFLVYGSHPSLAWPTNEVDTRMLDEDMRPRSYNDETEQTQQAESFVQPNQVGYVQAAP